MVFEDGGSKEEEIGYCYTMDTINESVHERKDIRSLHPYNTKRFKTVIIQPIVELRMSNADQAAQ